MKARSRSIVILSILFGYILLQFLWWEVLLVRQTSQIINEKQKLTELGVSDEIRLHAEVDALHHRKKMQTMMIVGEGTVFLLLLLFGIYKIKQAMDRESDLANQQRNFFLSITHELKTPIAATKLQLQTLLRQKLDEDTSRQLLNNALKENERLNQLIDNVLFASRLESEQFQIKTERIALASLIEDTVRRYYSTETIQLRLKSDLYANIDRMNFQSVLTNLIDNAIKYAGGTAQIEISVLQDGHTAIIEVADQGIGVKDGEKQKVFAKFFRSGDEQTRRTKGTGLGLYIVHYIVKQHKGEIRLRNNEPKGSIFEIRLPMA
jgi:signal transduction histidine kinase